MAQRKLIVEIVGDADSLHRALGTATKDTTRFGGTLGKLGKAAAFTAGGAAFGALTVAVRGGAEEFAESQRVAAQTNAVLKSTGKSAGVTAKHISDLAGELSNMSGEDDELIQSGENLLLTFTNIRNEVGKGNDIFDQATRTILDMSVALGQDTSSSAIQLGKALNDPIKGITALTRVGVSFTEAQKKQIAALVASGKTMEAQKVILAELTKEFGGSAEAAGKTLPGQLKILQQRLANLEGTVFAKAIEQAQEFAPAILKIADAIQKLMPVLLPLGKLMFDVFLTPMRVIADLITGRWAKAWKDFTAPVRHAIEVATAILGPFIAQVEKLQGLLDAITHPFGGTSRQDLQNEAIRHGLKKLADKAVGDLQDAIDPKRRRGFGVRGSSSRVGFSTVGAAAGVAGVGGTIITGPVTVVANDPQEFIRGMQKYARRQSPSRAGRFGGMNVGLS